MKHKLVSGGWTLLAIAAATLFFILIQLRFQFADPDLWGRLAMGALIVENGAFPYRDVFSYTFPNTPWFDHEWLSGLVFYALAAGGGETALLAFKYAIVLGVFACLFILHRRGYQASMLFGLLGSLALSPALGVTFYATPRAQLFTFFFFALFLLVLELVRLEKSPRRVLWALPALLVFWANAHGGFILGWLLMLAYGCGEALAQRQWKSGLPYLHAAALALVLVLFLNPYGPSYLNFMGMAWTLDRSHIPEWLPLDWQSRVDWNAQLAVLATILLVPLQWIFRRDKLALSAPSLVLLGAVIGTFKAVRFQTFLALALLAYLPLLLKIDWESTRLKIPAWLPKVRLGAEALIAIGLLLFALNGIRFVSPQYPLWQVPVISETPHPGRVPVRYPAGALQYLKLSPWSGNLLTPFGSGELALWWLHPRFKVAIDGRYEEVYPQEHFLTIQRLYNASPQELPAALALLNGSQTDFVLVDLQRPLLSGLLQDPNWKPVYGDPHFVLLARKQHLATQPAFEPMFITRPKSRRTLGSFLDPVEFERFRRSEP